KKAFCQEKNLKKAIKHLSSAQVNRVLTISREHRSKNLLIWLLLGAGLLLQPQPAFAQVSTSALWTKTGVIITLVLLLIPTLFAVGFLFHRINRRLLNLRFQAQQKEASKAAEIIQESDLPTLETALIDKKNALDYQLDRHELAGNQAAKDPKGLLIVNEASPIPIVSRKKKATQRPHVDPTIAKLVNGFLISATFWLLFGTSVGEYVGIKFVAPDLE